MHNFELKQTVDVFATVFELHFSSAILQEEHAQTSTEIETIIFKYRSRGMIVRGSHYCSMLFVIVFFVIVFRCFCFVWLFARGPPNLFFVACWLFGRSLQRSFARVNISYAIQCMRMLAFSLSIDASHTLCARTRARKKKKIDVLTFFFFFCFCFFFFFFLCVCLSCIACADVENVRELFYIANYVQKYTQLAVLLNC